MTKPTVWIIGIGGLLWAATAFYQGNRSQRGAPTGPFRTVSAQDGTFSLQLPADWQVREATLEDFFAWSPRGEFISGGDALIFADVGTMRSAVRALQSIGVPPQQLALMSRLVSPPLMPADVIRVFMPQLQGRQMQNMRILDSRALPPSGMPGMASRGALVVYQYTLVPAMGDALMRSLLAPPLQTLSSTAMEGMALVYASPPIFNVWDLTFQVVEGPQNVFKANWAIYNRISQSVRMNRDAIQRKQAEASRQIGSTAPPIDQERLRRFREGNIAAMNDPKIRESAEARWNVLGGEVGYKDPHDPSWRGQLPIGQMPSGFQRVWRCPGQNGPVISEKQPSYGCTEATELGH